MDSESFIKRHRDLESRMERNFREQEDRLSASWEETLRLEEERILRDLESFLDPPAIARADAFSRELDAIETAASRAARGEGQRDSAAASIEDLSIHSLFVLDRIVSALRHSIVENCLLNLHTFAEALGEKATDPALISEFQGQVGLLPGILKQVLDFFNRSLFLGVRVKHVLPAAFRTALSAVQGMIWVVRRFGRPKEKPVEVEGREVTERVDALTESLAELGKVLDGRRRSLGNAVRRAVETVGPSLETTGIAVRFEDRTGGSARLFLNETSILNAVGELLRNAARHGLAGRSGEREIRVLVTEAEPPSTELRVAVADNGTGFTKEVLARIGERGVSTSGGGDGLTLVREAAEEHLGRVEAENIEAGGARVTLILPRRPALADAALPVDPEGAGGLDSGPGM